MSETAVVAEKVSEYKEMNMKKVILSLMLLASSTAFAQHGHHGGYHGHRHGGGWGWAPWVGGAIVGAVVYDIYNRPVVVQQPPVIVQQPPVVAQQPLPPNTVLINGVAYTKQIMIVNGVQQEVLVRQ